MPTTRRPSLGDRRRLVIYSQRFNEDASGAVGRTTERSKEAKRSQAAYGSRVQRRLRARWYGLVPVKQRTLWAVATALFSLVSLLGVLHWCALWWGPIAGNEAIARPLRLDRADSFGTWFGAVMLVATAGASFLVYQLRRYKSDDYHGHYRIWRIAIVLSLVASVDCVTGLIDWFGGTIDVLLAERDFLAGADWVRLLLGFGGAAFALRMVAELSRSGWAAAIFAVSLLGHSIPLAVRWKLIEAQPEIVWLVVPIVTAFARAGSMLSVVIYLRLLYREVRRIESGERLAVRLRGVFRSDKRAEASTEKVAAVKPRSPGRKVSPVESAASQSQASSTRQVVRQKIASVDSTAGESSKEVSSKEEEGSASTKRSLWTRVRGLKSTDLKSKSERDDEVVGGEVASEKKGRSWLKLPKRQRAPKEELVEGEATGGQEVVAVQPKSRKLGGWFKSSKSGLTEEAMAKGSQVSVSRAESTDVKSKDEGSEEVSGKKGWFGRIMGKKRSTAEAGEENEVEVKEPALKRVVAASSKSGPTTSNVAKSAAPPAAARSTAQATESVDDDDDLGDEVSEDDPDLDPDSIDWGTLNKSERRRMRKVLKRQGKAA